MSKMSKNLLMWAGVAIVLILGYTYLSSNGQLSVLPTGFTALSLTQSIYSQSIDPILGEKPWILTLSPGGMGQYATGASAVIDNEAIISSNGSHAINDLSIKVISQKQVCHYPITRSTSDPSIYKFYQKEYGNFLLTSNESAKAECSKLSGPSAPIFIFKPAWSLNWNCVYGVKVAEVGKLPERPNVESVVEMEITSAGQTYKANLSSKDATQVKFGNVAYAQLVGGLQTYDQCPMALQNNVMGAYGSINNNWLLIDSGYYTQYVSILNTMYSDISWQSSQIQITAMLSRLNGASDSAYTMKEFKSVVSGYTSFISNSALDSGEATIDMNKQILVPVITLTVKASWLGIVTPIPKPQITYVSNATFTSGYPSSITVRVKNIGTQGGNINVALTNCQSPVTISNLGAVTTLTLQPNEEGQTTFQISGTASEPTSSVCTVKASAFGQEDVRTAYITVNNIILCTPNSRSCLGTDTVRNCNAYGMPTDTKCPSGQKCGTNQFGEVQCISEANISTCKPEGASVNTWLGEKCCENLVPDASNICRRLVTTCQDTTKIGDCSTVSVGYRCVVNVIGQPELKQDVTCSPPPSCTQDFQSLPVNGVCCNDSIKALGTCLSPYVLIFGSLAVVGGIVYVAYQKKGKKRR